MIEINRIHTFIFFDLDFKILKIALPKYQKSVNLNLNISNNVFLTRLLSIKKISEKNNKNYILVYNCFYTFNFYSFSNNYNQLTLIITNPFNESYVGYKYVLNK